MVLHGTRVQVTPTTGISDTLFGTSWETAATINDLKVGDPITVTGTSRGAIVFADSISRRGSYWDLHASDPILLLNQPTIEMLGLTITTDDSTQVSRCGVEPYSLDWLFGLAATDYYWLNVTLLPGSPSPVATRVEACSYGWD